MAEPFLFVTGAEKRRSGHARLVQKEWQKMVGELIIFFNIQFTKKYSQSNMPRLLRTINLVVVIKQSNLNNCFMVESRTVPWAKHGVGFILFKFHHYIT